MNWKNDVLSLVLALKGRPVLKAHQAILPVLQTSSFSAAFSKPNVRLVSLGSAIASVLSAAVALVALLHYK
jgi:hypothetical protein